MYRADDYAISIDVILVGKKTDNQVDSKHL